MKLTLARNVEFPIDNNGFVDAQKADLYALSNLEDAIAANDPRITKLIVGQSHMASFYNAIAKSKTLKTISRNNFSPYYDFALIFALTKNTSITTIISQNNDSAVAASIKQSNKSVVTYGYDTGNGTIQNHPLFARRTAYINSVITDLCAKNWGNIGYLPSHVFNALEDIHANDARIINIDFATFQSRWKDLLVDQAEKVIVSKDPNYALLPQEVRKVVISQKSVQDLISCVAADTQDAKRRRNIRVAKNFLHDSSTECLSSPLFWGANVLTTLGLALLIGVSVTVILSTAVNVSTLAICTIGACSIAPAALFAIKQFCESQYADNAIAKFV